MAYNVPKFDGTVLLVWQPPLADPHSFRGVHVLKIAQKHHFSAGNVTKIHITKALGLWDGRKWQVSLLGPK